MLSENFIPPEQKEYKNATPFQHICIKNMWNGKVLNEIASSLEDFDDWDGEKEFYGASAKRWCSTWNKLPKKVSDFIHYMSSPEFIEIIENMTGEQGLIPDPYLEGAGIHSISAGGFLKMHVDFNWHKKLRLYRRLNLLVYLNPDWDEAWAGDLRLAVNSEDGSLNNERSIFPHMNTTVVFTTDEISLHGHPEPLVCPQGEKRNSIALYYYVAQLPSEMDTDQRTNTMYSTSLGKPVGFTKKISYMVKSKVRNLTGVFFRR